MKRERTNKLNRVRDQITIAERNFESAVAKTTYWEGRLNQLRKEELSIQLESQLPLGRSTKKNQKKQIVWASIQEILIDPSRRAGMTTAELHQAALEHHRSLNIITFRAYLLEFSRPKRRLLQKKGDRWHLADAFNYLQK